jgi:hypothetical protein
LTQVLYVRCQEASQLPQVLLARPLASSLYQHPKQQLSPEQDCRQV